MPLAYSPVIASIVVAAAAGALAAGLGYTFEPRDRRVNRPGAA